MLEFNSVPEKKSSFYLVRCNNNIQIRLNNVDLRKKYILGNKTYYSYYIHDKEDREKLSNVEIDARDAVLEKNKEWFKNNLTNDDIVEMYEPSYDDQSQYLEVLHLDKFPAIITGNNNLSNCITCITVQLLGICINKNSYSVKWVLKSMETIDVDELDDDLEIEWENKISNFEREIDVRINKLMKAKENVRELFKSKDWDNLSKCVEEIYTH